MVSQLQIFRCECILCSKCRNKESQKGPQGGGKSFIEGSSAVTGSSVVCGLCCHQRLSGFPWSGPLPETRQMSMIHADQQGSSLCSGINDCRLTVENERLKSSVTATDPGSEVQSIITKVGTWQRPGRHGAGGAWSSTSSSEGC